jgi:acetyltransferase-like isoleucine patch superfamily enzyme
MPNDRFENWKPPKIEERKINEYNWLVQNNENLQLGYKTDIGAFTYVNAKFNVIIEDHVQIGSHCSIYSVSTIDNKEGPVTLKKNCRVGTHSVVMPNVTIGENSIIGAFSFVTKDIPKNVVAFGVPAKVKRNLTEKEIKELEASL